MTLVTIVKIWCTIIKHAVSMQNSIRQNDRTSSQDVLNMDKYHATKMVDVYQALARRKTRANTLGASDQL